MPLSTLIKCIDTLRTASKEESHVFTISNDENEPMKKTHSRNKQLVDVADE